MTLEGTTSTTRAQRRVNAATLIGTTIEWYDFFIYGTAAGLVFAQLFFQPAGSQIGTLLSFATIAISFFFRPLGGVLAGHFGDKLGRRTMLVLTLVLMGGATTLIGLLPTYATIGVAAPILLILLRVLQGISAGGEWAGAALMAVEHAPVDRRGRAGSYPQIGVPLGMLLAAGVNALMTGVISPGDAYLAWGWRVPFLLSFVLIIVGYFVRRAVDESPVFSEMREKKQHERVPLARLFANHRMLGILAAFVFVGVNAVGYMIVGGFIANYATNPDGPVGLERTAVLNAISIGAFVWGIFTWLSAVWSDKIGRRRAYAIGYITLGVTIFPFFWLMESGSIALLTLGLVLLGAGLGLTYGPLPAWYAELFPASIRYSGSAITYAIGAILGGAFAPLIAQALVQSTGSTTWVAVYLVGTVVISLIGVAGLRDRSGIDLRADNELEQEIGATIFDSRPVPAAVRAQA